MQYLGLAAVADGVWPGQSSISYEVPYPPGGSTDILAPNIGRLLGGGAYRDQPEYQASTLTPEGLERIRYAAYLYQKTQLPILVTGGSPYGGEPAADVMRHELTQYFKTPVAWVETKSGNTTQNALLKFIPQAVSLQKSNTALHEWVGIAAGNVLGK